MLIYSLLALPYPASLFAYHVFLLARGETTREYLNSHKFLPRDRHRPFTLGGKWTRNWIAGLCRPRGLGYLDFGKKWETGDGRFGFWVGKKERKARNKGAFSLGGKELGDGGGGERGLEGDVEKFGNGYGINANGGAGGSHAAGVEMRKLSPSASAQRSEGRRRRKSSPTNNNDNVGSTTPAGSASRSGSNAPSSTGGGGGLAHLQQASRSSAGLSLGGSGRGSLGAGGLNSTPR
ncbi:hypothetical protein KC319_g16518 [Hortaea werneckii]|nr:hypothetical protein KC319_g16518 [Hortaea werneckii]